jgi:hypothetical protein
MRVGFNKSVHEDKCKAIARKAYKEAAAAFNATAPNLD